MRYRFTLPILLIAVSVFSRTAEGHFLFIRIGEPAEAGRTVEVFFSERAQAGDPRFIAKTAGTTLTLQAAPGKFQPLTVRKGTDRLRAYLPAAGPVSVTGFLEYGVLKRDVSFLLRYYPKAIAGDSPKMAAFQRQSSDPLEIDASLKGDRVSFSLLRNGRPVPGAVFTTVDDDLVNEELKADRAGKAEWKPPSPGFYCVYAKSVLKSSGTYRGEAYSEIREFATIAFRWPLHRTDADPEAVALFQKALAARATWDNFPGFSADVSGSIDGREFQGNARVDAKGDLVLKLDEEVVRPWVEEQIASLVMHRLPTGRSDAKRAVLRYADQDTSNPLGRLLVFDGGQFASSYRIVDDQITVVNRNIGGQNMTITVLENTKNANGKQLPRSYTVQYWKAEDGTLERSDSFSNRWIRVGNFDLPASLTATLASKAGLSTRTIQFTNHHLTTAK